MNDSTSLKRVLSLPQMVLYGLGTTIGAGIYALVGELAAVSGYSALAAFVLAALMAGLTAMSFAELSGRYPHAAGAAVYVGEGFGSVRASTAVGLLVIAAGLVSAAALINALVGHVIDWVPVARAVIVIGLALLLGAIAMWGIAESVTIAGVITALEIGGLLLVIWVGRGSLAADTEQWRPLLEGFALPHWGVVYAGALLAFYAFIGFEDMVVVAEEVRGVSRTLPRAILITLLITGLLYLAIMAEALLTFTPAELGRSDTPLVDLFAHYRPDWAWAINAVASVAIINGALIQMIMASRVIYGLARRGQLPERLAAVNARTRTPLIATAIVTVAVGVLAVVGHLAILATLTSVIMLSVFAAANLALWRIKGRATGAPPPFNFPRWIPGLGFVVSLVFVLGFFYDLWRHAG